MKKPAKTRAKKAPANPKPDRSPDDIGGTTVSAETTGDLPAQEPTHQPGVSVEPGLDPRTPPNAN